MASAPAPYARRKGWFERNWKIALPVCIVLGGGVLTAFMAAIFGMLGHSEAVSLAMAKARSSPALIAKIGEPIKQELLISGSIRTNGDNGAATLSIPVSGPKGKATLDVEAKKHAGVWSLERLTATVPGQAEPLDLLKESANSGSF